jgi:hypothetical protein
MPVGAEIDEAAHGAFRTDLLSDLDLVEPVLGRKHEAVRSEMRRQLLQRSFGRHRFHGEHDTVVGAGDVTRLDRGEGDLERVDRTGDLQPGRAAGLHVVSHDVDQQHRHAGACPPGAERAADRACAPDQDRFGWAHRGTGL